MNITTVLKQIKTNRNNHEFITTGFKGLDSILDGGFLKKELVVIGGSTGAGKSYMAIHLANQAAAAGFKTGYFSLEISNELVVARMIGQRGSLKSSHILYGMVDEGDRQYLLAQSEVMGLGDLFEVYDDVYDLAAIDKLIRENKFDVIFIDFIQNIQGSRPDEYERLSYISLHLQKLAKATNSCIVVLSQLSNAVSRETNDKRAVEYKGSGSIATVADLGFFLNKVPQKDDLQLIENAEGYEFTLAKNRRGPSKQTVKLRVTWPGGTFYEN